MDQPTRQQRARARGGQETRGAERRRAILEAASATFVQVGFAAARMEDVASRAGVAKGTIYLYFADKERLFEGIVRHAMVPVVGQALAGAPEPGESVRDFLVRTGRTIAASLADGERAAIIRLLVAEGPRFPALTELYFRDVVEPAMRRVREVAALGRAAGELPDDALARFPQLLIAPVLLGVLWSSLFGRLEPLDVGEMMERQVRLLLRDPDG